MRPCFEIAIRVAIIFIRLVRTTKKPKLILAIEMLLEVRDAFHNGSPMFATDVAELRVADAHAPGFRALVLRCARLRDVWRRYTSTHSRASAHFMGGTRKLLFH